MSDREAAMTDTSEAHDPHSLDAPTPPGLLEAIPRETEGSDEEYTLVPRGVEGADLMTHWITVDGDHIVDLSAWR